MAQIVKNLPAVRETQVQFLAREDPLEKGVETHSSILAWRIPGTEEPGGQQFMGSQRVGHNRATFMFRYYYRFWGYKNHYDPCSRCLHLEKETKK